MTTSEKLCSIRAKHKVTNQQIADLSGVPIGTVSGMMSGQVASPNFQAVCAILTALNEDITAFYTGQEPPEAPQSGNIDQINHMQEFAIKIVTEAITRAYVSDVAQRSERRERRAMILNMFFIALIVFFLIWDITHPTMGFIQY